jgi:hypothetical protein
LRPSNPKLTQTNSSNTVLLFLFLWNSPNMYTLVWKHTNKWRNICTFQITSTKKNSSSNPQLTPTTLQIQSRYSYSYEIPPLNRQLMLWNFQIQYSYLHSNAILNIKLYSCISLGLKITQIKIPRNIVERLWHINNVMSYEDFQFKM